ncbi:hypothetical protein TVAG_340440 [Trichomonas vaginalis G3]|uniref:RING-type domain-containing protein n=1 Tax=Trichomonas vaginalis (strain ATCC PRA-98 / G3) TaxID=412133 RepID=A2EKF8_TRIV3|nr:pectin lyase-like family [Trichomonas vaginalis G3]EAY06866.1 hypothetical protein TVAG_340440 [Trichomonas vaginalis G3]KAI5489190.1 pectin lyase-like family [Trichomonas vaginalis G3]|eukprot:XP_001319089.1 hypothetical protein [Trichomonas vaginalis G3]
MNFKCVANLGFCKQLPKLLSEISFPTKNHEVKLLPGTKVDSEIFIRTTLTLNGFGMDSKITRIKTMNIVSTEVKFTDVNFSGNIIVSTGSKFYATNCNFNCSCEKQDAIIEISPNAVCEFTNCNFYGGNQSSITSNGPNNITFNNCSFLKAPVTSLVLSNETGVKFYNCQFQDATKYSVLITKKSNGSFNSCTFAQIPGKAIAACTESMISLSDSKFSECQNGVLCSCDQTVVKITNSEFKDIPTIGITLSKGSNAYIEGSSFDNCSRALIVNRSYVVLNKTSFKNCIFLVIGKYCPQIITNNQFLNSEIGITDGCNPIFKNNQVVNSVVRCGDFSKPLLINTPITELVSSNCSQVFLYHSPRQQEKCILGAEIIDTESENFEIQRKNGVFKYSNGEYQIPEENIDYVPPNGYQDLPLIFIPCGHLCSTECDKCPVCGISGRTSKRFKTDRCVICMDAAPELVFMPCGHQCCCHECGLSAAEGKKCPICGVIACATKKMFM